MDGKFNPFEDNLSCTQSCPPSARNFASSACRTLLHLYALFDSSNHLISLFDLQLYLFRGLAEKYSASSPLKSFAVAYFVGGVRCFGTIFTVFRETFKDLTQNLRRLYCLVGV